jgi:hypothetical protein
MRELEIQKILRLYGLHHTVELLNLTVKEDGDLVLLKYKQIFADWTNPATHECRGIILDKSDNFSIVSFPYEKFWNISEGYCAIIDWNTAKIYEKLDGSLINLYYYKDKWCVQTSGTISANSTANNNLTTFESLVWKSVTLMYGSKDAFIQMLDTTYNYMFELCTPENIVVTPHSDYTLKLHGIRDMKYLNFINIDDSKLVKAHTYDLKSVDEMLLKFNDMNWMEEGFVVCDANFNRAKLKNPKYVAVHHVSTGVSPYSIINVIKTNEIEEFITYFVSRKEELYDLESKWLAVEKYLIDYYNSIKHIEDTKEFALKVLSGKLNKIYTGIMFALKNNKLESVWTGMCNIENRYWYNLFKK